MNPFAWIALFLIVAGIGSLVYNPLAGVAPGDFPVIAGDLPAVLIVCGIGLLSILNHDRHHFR